MKNWIMVNLLMSTCHAFPWYCLWEHLPFISWFPWYYICVSWWAGFQYHLCVIWISNMLTGHGWLVISSLHNWLLSVYFDLDKMSLRPNFLISTWPDITGIINATDQVWIWLVCRWVKIEEVAIKILLIHLALVLHTMYQWTGSVLLQGMACHLVSAKPLPWWLGTEQATSHYLNQCWPCSPTHICFTNANMRH